MTVVFTDVAGSTALGERLDPESLRRVMWRYFDAMQPILERHGGTVEKFIGDAIVAVFGVPAVHEDDALRAVRAAGEMREALELVNESLAAEYGVRIATRTGVNTGEVIVGETASRSEARDRRRRQRRGTPRAGRAGGRSAPRRVHVRPRPGRRRRGAGTARRGQGEEPATRGLAARRAATRRAGVRAPRPYAVRRPPTRARRAPRGVDDACARVVVPLATIVGPPGIGKSRLAREVLGSFHEARAVVGRCVAYGEGVTYLPLAEIVRQIAGAEPEPVLTRILSEVERGPIATRLIMGALGANDEPGSPEETAWAFRRLFEALAASRPLVVVVDDIHWADETLLDLLEYLVGFSSGAPILLLCLARPDVFDVRPSWGAPRTGTTLVSLSPLSDDESEGLIDGLWGDETSRPRSAIASSTWPRATRCSSSRCSRCSRTIPRPQTRPCRRRSRLCSRPASTVSSRTSGSCSSGDRWKAGCSTAVPSRSCSRQRRRAGRHPPHPRPQGARSPRPLVVRRRRRISLQPCADPGRRVRLDAQGAPSRPPRAARRLAGGAHRRALTGHEEIVGYHLEQAYLARAELGRVTAGPALSPEGRSPAGPRRTPRARSRRAATAASLLERACRLLAAEPRERAGFLTDLGGAFRGTGALDAADTALTEAIEEARRHDDAPTELRAEMERARVAFMRTRPNRTTSANIARRAFAVFEPIGSDADLADAWMLMGIAELAAGDRGGQLAALQRCREHALASGDLRRQIESWNEVGGAMLFGRTPVDEVLAFLDEELAWAQERGLAAVEADALLGGPYLYSRLGRFDEARDRLERSKSICRELGIAYGLAEAHMAGAQMEMLAGDADAAERELRDAIRIATDMGASRYVALYRRLLADVLLAQGRTDEAAAELEQARPVYGHAARGRLPRHECSRAAARPRRRSRWPAKRRPPWSTATTSRRTPRRWAPGGGAPRPRRRSGRRSCSCRGDRPPRAEGECPARGPPPARSDAEISSRAAGAPPSRAAPAWRGCST